MSEPILYLTTSGQVGGAERCLLSLTAGLDRARFEPQVVIGSEGPLAGMLESQGVAAEVLALPTGMRRLSRYHANPGAWARISPLLQTPGYLLRLRRAGRERRPRLVHSNGLKMHCLSAALGSSWRAPLIWHLHDFPPQGGAEQALRRLSRRPALALANSAAVAQAYARAFPRLEPKLRVLPNGVSLERMSAGGERGRAAMRQRWQLGPEDFVIGMTAIFAPWKGQAVFLQAARRALESAPGLRFVLVGDDIYDTRGHGGRRQELEALARELGIAEAVRFAGFVGDEIAAAYAALDVMVHASTEPEPFGRTVIEAMAAGVPVVAAAAGGVVEIVQDGESGRLTPPGDAAALAAALLELQGNAGLRRHLREQGLRRVRERYAEEVIGRELETIYTELLSKPQ